MAGTSRKDSRGRKLPPNVSQKADGRYIWRKTIDGQKYVITANKLEDLKRKIIKAESEIQEGIYTKPEKLTLNGWFNKWLDVYKSNLKITTRELYKRTWKTYIKDSKIGGMQVAKLKRIHIVELYKSLINDKGLAETTVGRIHGMLSGCFSDLTEDGYIKSNPTSGAYSKVCTSKAKPRQALTITQQENFIDYVANSNLYKVYLPMFSFFLGTGVRVGELTGLTWEDIDLRKGIVKIKRSLCYSQVDEKTDFIITTPKTESGEREIPLIMSLRKQLIGQKKYDSLLGISGNAVVGGLTDFVFHTRSGKPRTNVEINNLLGRIIKAYNQQEEEKAEKEHREPELLPHFTVHNLRHTFCTRFCENETNIKAIQTIMGHKDIKTTMNIYNHVTKEKSKEVMNNLETKIKIC